MIGAREAALLALYDIYFNGAYSNLAVKEMLNKCRGMKKNEKALFTNLAYGVVSRYYTTEYIIKEYSSVKVKKLAKYVRIILALGIYQILYMDKVPDSAAVNECVKLSKKYCRKGSDRFINGVLRTVSKEKDNIGYPTDKREYLSVKYSFSLDMIDKLLKFYDYEFAEELMSSLNEPAPIILRPNTLKVTADELVLLLKEQDVECEKSEECVVVKKGFDIANNKLFTEGFFSVQDKGAYTASIILSPEENQTVIDMCAAPGGKTTHIAELMKNTGRVISCDIYEHKIRLIENAAKRLGLNNISAVVLNSQVFHSEFENIADRVLCDVPCSGWGIIRRKPDIKLSHTENEGLHDIQYSILSNAARYVKKGGVIVYSTCTLNKEENEYITDEFIKNNNNFEKVYEKTFYPNIDNSDGFYICRLNRND